MKHILAVILTGICLIIGSPIVRAASIEMPTLTREEKIGRAQSCLWYLRLGTSTYQFCIESIYESVRRRDFTLAELKTSEAELEKLKLLGARTSAIMWLGILRDGAVNNEFALENFRRELDNSKLSYRDVGTSEQELSRLRK